MTGTMKTVRSIRRTPVPRSSPLWARVALAGLALAAAPAAHAQCQQQWSGDFGIPPGTSGNVYAMTNFDTDGAGPKPAELVIAGSFGTAGGVGANKIARWDGKRWNPFANGIGTNSAVYINCMTNWDSDGAGPLPAQLIIGGNFALQGNFIERWDAATQDWAAVGTGMNNILRCLTTWDPDGTGPIQPFLIAGGDFTTAGGVTVNRIARWDGAAWQPMGAGANGSVCAVTTLDPDGAGPLPPVLVAGGNFTSISGVAANRIARFDGLAWAPFGTGMNNIVWAFEHWDAGVGGGPQMIASGDFTTANGVTVNRIARWDGSTFQPFGTGMNSTVYSLTNWDPDGPGAAAKRLVAGGAFTTAGGAAANHIAHWDGTTWGTPPTTVNGNVIYAVATTDVDKTGPAWPQLVAGGDFTLAAGSIANRVAVWASAPSPLVITSPSDTVTCPGGQALFHVRAAAGAFPSYRWRRNGVDLADGPTPQGSSILGSGSIQLTISGATLDDAGLYDVVVTSACGSSASEAATLTFCYANCDCSATAPTLNVADFTCFLTKFAGGTPYANCDQSTLNPTLNVADFTCFLTKFAGGCPQ